MNKRFECIITRRLRIIQSDMTDDEVTDWVSDKETGRIDPRIWNNFIYAVASGEMTDFLATESKEGIEWVGNNG